MRLFQVSRAKELIFQKFTLGDGEVQLQEVKTYNRSQRDYRVNKLPKKMKSKTFIEV